MTCEQKLDYIISRVDTLVLKVDNVDSNLVELYTSVSNNMNEIVSTKNLVQTNHDLLSSSSSNPDVPAVSNDDIIFIKDSIVTIKTFLGLP